MYHHHHDQVDRWCWITRGPRTCICLTCGGARAVYVSYTLYETDHLLIVSAPLTENLLDQSAKFSVLGLDWVVVTFCIWKLYLWRRNYKDITAILPKRSLLLRRFWFVFSFSAAISVDCQDDLDKLSANTINNGDNYEMLCVFVATNHRGKGGMLL